MLNQGIASSITSRAKTDAPIHTDSEKRLSENPKGQINKSTTIKVTSLERNEATSQNTTGFPELEPTEKAAPVPTPTFKERPAVAAQPRAPQPIVSKSSRHNVELSPLAKELQQMIEQMNEQRTNSKPLPVPDTPPVRPYTVITEVNLGRPAAELSAEFIQLANKNQLAIAGQEIAAPIQRLMRDNLMQLASQPTAPEQLQSIQDLSRKLGLSEQPDVSTALQATLWRAHNDPNHAALLTNFTQATETAFVQQLQMQAVEPILSQQSLMQDDNFTIE